MKSFLNGFWSCLHQKKNSACLEINFIKICPEIALKYFFFLNVVLYEIYSKKSKVTNTYVHGLYLYIFRISTRIKHLWGDYYKDLLKVLQTFKKYSIFDWYRIYTFHCISKRKGTLVQVVYNCWKQKEKYRALKNISFFIVLYFLYVKSKLYTLYIIKIVHKHYVDLLTYHVETLTYILYPIPFINIESETIFLKYSFV